MQVIEAPKVVKEEYKTGYRAPAEIPLASEGEEFQQYITQIKEDSQISYLTCCGINFEKYVVSTDASLVKNQGKVAKQKILTRQFTRKQYEYLQKRLSEKELKVFNEETGQYRKVKASEEVLFIPLSEYNPNQNFVTKETKPIADSEVKERLAIASPVSVEDFPKLKSKKV